MIHRLSHLHRSRWRIEKSQRDENAILSSNEFTELENRIKGHIETIENTDAAVKKAESARVTGQKMRG